MDLHTLSTLGEVKFSTTDHNDFLSKCETLYTEVSTTDWEDFETLEQLPEIFENHGYFYNVVNANQVLKINNNSDLVNLYFKLQKDNPTIDFDNGTSLMIASNFLLNNYNEPTLNYLKDNQNEVSLLQQIVGNDGMEQLNFHKGFKESFNVSIY